MNALTLEKIKERCGGWHLDAVVLGSLFLFHAINNWIWAVSNVTLLGWDRNSHLGKTLIYFDILQAINPRDLVSALTWQTYRPPLVFVVAAVCYRFWGRSTDTALMSNVLYVAMTLVGTYGIGRKICGRQVGLLAAFLVSVYPILFSLSRAFYVDYALVAFVTTSIYLLLLSDHFRDRKYSLIWGLSLGFGMLVKWTFAAFLIGPSVYIVVRSRVLLFTSGRGVNAWFMRKPDLLPRFSLRGIWGWPATHVSIGLLLTLIWYVPNRPEVRELPLGDWLFLLSWGLWSGLLYVISRRPSPRVNFVTSLLLGALVAAPWYLLNIGFLPAFLFYAYGGGGLGADTVDFTAPSTYVQYLGTMASEQVSLLFFALFVLALGALGWRIFNEKRVRRTFRNLDSGRIVLVLWPIVSYAVFTLSRIRNSRFTIPLLPAVAILTACGLREISNRRVRASILAILVVLGMAQFMILSFDGFAWIGEALVADLDPGPSISLFARGGYNLTPNLGPTDSRYWVAPQILRSVQDAEAGAARLCSLVNNTHLNADILGYLILLEFPQVELRDLARDNSGRPVYAQLFECDFVLVTTGDPYKLSDGAKEAVRELDESPEVFEQVFELKAEYEFPDGEVASLYGTRLPPADQQVQEYYRHLVGALEAVLTEGSAIVLVSPTEIATFAAFYEGAAPVYLLPTGDPGEDVRVLEEIAATNARMHAIFRAEEHAPQSPAERWLSENAYRAIDEWYGDVRLAVFGTPGEETQSSQQYPKQTELGGEVSLVGYELAEETIAPDQILRLTLLWQSVAHASDDYVVFVHLLDGDGRLIAQHDGEPVGGFRSITTWQMGETVEDKHGILIPQGTPSGEYRLVAGMYLPATGERLLATGAGSELGEDTIFLTTIRISGEETASDSDGTE